jgi:GTP-binding protein
MSNCKPKIASYHFTTLTPNLGMVKVDEDRSFVMADLPGLIEGASQGAGLGFEFLRHIERCRVIVHVIDMAGTEGRNPIEDYEIINNELKSYKMNLYKRPQIVVANKMEMPLAKENLEAFKKAYPNLEVIEVSALNRINLDELKYKVYDLIQQTPRFDILEDDEKDTVTY